MTIRLFNLDLHISVIADFKNIVEKLFGDKIEITDWSISEHTWVFNKTTQNVHIINQNGWKNINEEMVNNFIEVYGEFLETFDGFIVTHTPVFCRIYERFKKPILLINTCRYEQPYSWTHQIDEWLLLNDSLKGLRDSGLLFAVSNNRADQEYLKLGTGIDSIHIPSLCEYTGVSWSKSDEPPLVYSNDSYVTDKEAYGIDMKGIVKRLQLGEKIPWQKLMQRKCIIHIPYEISTMSIAEQYSAGVPLFFPSKYFLQTLWMFNEIDFQGPYARECQIPESLVIPLDSPDAHMWWLDRADYYDPDNMKHVTYFDSLEDLIKKVAEFTESEDRVAERRDWLKQRRENILRQWSEILLRAFPSLKIEAA